MKLISKMETEGMLKCKQLIDLIKDKLKELSSYNFYRVKRYVSRKKMRWDYKFGIWDRASKERIAVTVCNGAVYETEIKTN